MENLSKYLKPEQLTRIAGAVDGAKQQWDKYFTGGTANELTMPGDLGKLWLPNSGATLRPEFGAQANMQNNTSGQSIPAMPQINMPSIDIPKMTMPNWSERGASMSNRTDAMANRSQALATKMADWNPGGHASSMNVNRPRPTNRWRLGNV